jgi:hypothetical protein
VLGGSVVIFFDRRLVDLDALGFNNGTDLLGLELLGSGRAMSTYLCLELRQVGGAKGISLGNDWDQVDSGAKSLHDLDVEGLEGVAGRADKVEAGMDS